MKILDIALHEAKKMGAHYADIRVQDTREESLMLRNLSLKDTNHQHQYGYGIRVLKDGAWGFAHCNRFSEEDVRKTVRVALEIAGQSARVKNGEGIVLAPERGYIETWASQVKIDPFSVPLQEKVDMMLESNKALLNYQEIRMASFYLHSRRDHKIFASTEGSLIEQDVTAMILYLTANAVANGDSQSRTLDPGGKAMGWEYIQAINPLGQVDRIANEAIQKAYAGTLGEEKRRSLIIDPVNLSLTMHESVGHPTELDRVLGWEADFAGVSFATPEKLGNYRYGSEIVNFFGDNTLEGGLATARYDDDGVPGQKWYIVKDGILNEYGTTRETAPFIGLNFSRGCNRATYYYDIPINRIPNLYLEPGTQTLTPQEIISDTEDGVWIEGLGSFSIDQHRLNFQFGGDLFWEIKNGKKTRMLKKVLYKSNNPEFWNSCDAIADRRFFRTYGVPNCGKGQPGQAGRMTHGAAPARFRNIRVGGSQ